MRLDVGEGGLRGLVHCHQWRGGEQQLHVVRFLVGGAHLITDVVGGCRQQVVVVDEHRCGERHVEFYWSAGKSVVRRSGHHTDRLLHSLNHSVTLLRFYFIQSKVGIGATGGIVAMGCDDVVAGMQQFLQVVV